MAAFTSGAYMALLSAVSATGIPTELIGSNYVRQSIGITFDPISRFVTLNSGVTFGPMSGTLATASFVGVFDASSGGNFLFYLPISAVTLTSGTSYSYASGLMFTANALFSNPPSITNIPGVSILGVTPTGTSVVAGSVGLTYTASASIGATTASYLPQSQSPVTFRDLLDGADFTINPFQRNVPGLATSGVANTIATSTPIYFADRWFAVGGASSSITQAMIASTAAAGYIQALVFGRTAANSNTTPINFGHVMETLDCIRLQGMSMSLAFTALLGANYSGGQVTATVYTGTGNNQSAASLAAGTWTGQATAFTTAFTLSTTAARYQMSGTIPTTATQVGVLFTYTPSGTAGAADNIQFFDVDLSPGTPASPAERRDAQVELEICQRYAAIFSEPAAGVTLATGGTTVAANAQRFMLPLPVQMYKAPTVTLAAGGFKVAAGATAAAATGLAANNTHTVTIIGVNTALTQSIGASAELQGGGGSGYILASADF